MAKGTYADFLEQFAKITWDTDRKDFPVSFFVNEPGHIGYRNKIHARMFVFNGVGMVISNMWEYAKVENWLKDHDYRKEQKVSIKDTSFWKEK
jgi:hypothetical protein